jgi:hypothetical protein
MHVYTRFSLVLCGDHGPQQATKVRTDLLAVAVFCWQARSTATLLFQQYSQPRSLLVLFLKTSALFNVIFVLTRQDHKL